ncbi:MAG: ABC transporter substrate-binding protein [Bacteroidales bacterium]|jgi:branched-chain amino acid transport system substrate-binding protein|nr:ABC transporter substrate-binding protein [Bacteroidales bacterium]
MIKNILYIILAFVFFSCENLEEDFNEKKYENPIKIAVIGDITVVERENIENYFFGAQLACEEINISGGITINGKKHEIQPIYKNSETSPEKGIEIVNECVNENINIIVGPTVSSVAIPMAEKCIENNILMMSYSATNPNITHLNDSNLIWRTCPSDNYSGSVEAQYAYNTLHSSKAGILYRDDVFGLELSNEIKEKFENEGGQVVSTVSFPADDIDFQTYNFNGILSELFADKPDIIFTAFFNTEIGKITYEINKHPLYAEYEEKPILFVNDGIIASEILSNGNQDVAETIIGVSSTNYTNNNYIVFRNNYLSRFGFLPVTYTEHTYDAIYSIAYAIQQKNSYNVDSIKSSLRYVSGGINSNNSTIVDVNNFAYGKQTLASGEMIDYQGASGPIDFDANGDCKSVLTIWEIQNMEYVELDKIQK